MRYPHLLRIERPGEGGEHLPSGEWQDAPPLVLYSGAADVQDEGEEVSRSADDRIVTRSDAVAYLADETNVGRIRTGDHAEIDWRDGATSTASVIKAVRLDGKVHLRWVR